MAARITGGEAGVKDAEPRRQRSEGFRLRRWLYGSVATIALVGTGAGAVLSIGEARTSRLQSRYFSDIARGVAYTKAIDPNDPSLRLPAGPYDLRYGYAGALEIRRQLESKGFRLAQPMPAWKEREIAGISLFPIYNEKARAGFTLTDDNGKNLHVSRFPRDGYIDFSAVPPLLVSSLLFVENRELLGDHAATQNPAIEWDRFFGAFVGYGAKKIGFGTEGGGGSTLATQLEKLRHSPDGLTSSPSEKIRQMLSASVRAYQNGTDTREVRLRIVTDYLNAMPLAAKSGFGEVVGFADGMALWFGAGFEEVNRRLARPEALLGDGELRDFAKTYREALTLVMAVQRPSELQSQSGRKALQGRIDRFLPIMAEAGIISRRLMDATLAASVEYASSGAAQDRRTQPGEKSVNTLRAGMMQMVGAENLYTLDRMDLSASATIDGEISAAVTAKLKSFNDPEQAKANSITGGYPLLREELADQVVYSFALYEKGADGANLLRVQTDNFDGALNLNEGSKLELGSTAKLRTLVSYLEAVAELHARYADQSPEALSAISVNANDRISAWALEYLTAWETDKSLEAMLDAAMTRAYSASTGESFFTGGGLHRFHNFKGSDNGRVMPVREAFQNSVNLPFVRIMRDVVNYTMASRMHVDLALFEDPDHPDRQKYLEKFVDTESQSYLWRYWGEQRGKSPDETLSLLAAKTYRSPVHLAVLFRMLRPDDAYGEMREFLRRECPSFREDEDYTGTFEKYGPEKFDLNDQGYITSVHPLALWLAAERIKTPDLSWDQAVENSSDARKFVYKWLFKPNKFRGQNRRIQTMLEREAFENIHASWKEKGFPFDKMIPSYASALGASGDTPAALATLSGIIQNGGAKNPLIKFTGIEFGKDTPYEMHFAPDTGEAVQVMPREVAQAVLHEMQGVVEKGTASRAHEVVKLSDGRVLPVGGKTGTGDNRLKSFARGGGITGATVKSRTATFIFAIDDRFFGSIVAYVPGEDAAKHRFTSALPVQVFKALVPTILPLLDRAYDVQPPQQAVTKPAAPKIS